MPLEPMSLTSAPECLSPKTAHCMSHAIEPENVISRNSVVVEVACHYLPEPNANVVHAMMHPFA